MIYRRLAPLAGLAALLLLVQKASAQGGMALLCGNIPGGCPDASTQLETLFTSVGFLFLEVAAAVAMFFIVWGGILMVASLGDESQVATGRNSVIYAMIGLAVVLSAQMFLIVLTPLGNAGTPREAANIIIAIPKNLLNLVFSVMIVITAFQLLLARGRSDEVEKGRRMLLYAIIGAVVVNLAPALFTAVANIFF